MTDVIGTGIDLMGWMKKKGKIFGVWKGYYVELHKKDLYIRKNNREGKIRHHYSINPETRINVIDSKKRPYIEICMPNTRPVRLQPDSEESLFQWANALRSAAADKTQLTVDSFDVISVIGRGFYGKVFLAQLKGTDEYFALKAVKKEQLVSSNQTRTIVEEKTILQKVSHPFIVDLKFAFQTASKFYVGLEYLPGGDLFGLIQRRGRIPIEDVRIYAGEIALALEHLHSHGIVYRDLKPENVLIAADGHLKLTDFGLSKDITQEGTTRTFCGTGEFIAPEIIIGRPYGFSADWWSFGVLIYQLLFGDTPFYNPSRKQMHNNIRYADPKYPEGIDPSIISFINGFLCKSPLCRSTYQKVENHPFWDDVTRKSLMMKDKQPSFIPRISMSTSTEYFDETFTTEEVNDSDAEPMLGEENIIRGFSYISDEMSK